MAPAAGRARLDFFAAQEGARRRTAWLVLSFALAVLTVTAIVYLAVLLLAGQFHGVAPAHVDPTLYRRDLFAATVLGVWSVVGAGALYHSLQLSAGGEALAARLGGTRVPHDTTDPAERRLVNVVEEMALAAGAPVPKTFVLGREEAINAFAAGATPERAVIAVTRGAIDRLSRDELQGVVAHELSHLLNADTRIDLRLMAAVGGLSAIAAIGRVILEWTPRSSSRRSGGGVVVFFGLALLVAGAIGTFFGNLVRFAVARQREWLADASSVQFTRNPDGLAGALRKIAAEGSILATPRAPEAAHLFFARGTSGAFDSLFSTHPPIEERIRALAPHAPATAPIARPPGVATASGPDGALGLAPPRLAGSLEASTRVLSDLPPALREAAAGAYGARGVVAALLLDRTPVARALQIEGLRRLDAALAGEAARVATAVDPMPDDRRLGLLELALPALDDLSPTQAGALGEALDALAEADGVVTPFEQAVLRAARRRLGRAGAAPGPVLRRPDDAAVECLELLSALAWVGGRDAATAENALRAGLRTLGLDAAWRILPRERATRANFDRALARLDLASFALKGRILDACVAVARADGAVTGPEGNVLHAIASAFGVPSPGAGSRCTEPDGDRAG